MTHRTIHGQIIHFCEFCCLLLVQRTRNRHQYNIMVTLYVDQPLQPPSVCWFTFSHLPLQCAQLASGSSWKALDWRSSAPSASTTPCLPILLQERHNSALFYLSIFHLSNTKITWSGDVRVLPFQSRSSNTEEPRWMVVCYWLLITHWLAMRCSATSSGELSGFLAAGSSSMQSRSLSVSSPDWRLDLLKLK